MQIRIAVFFVLSLFLLAGCSLEVKRSEEFNITDDEEKSNADEIKEMDYIDTTHKTIDGLIDDLETLPTIYKEKEDLLTDKQRFQYSSTMLAMDGALEEVETIHSLTQESLHTKDTKKQEELLNMLDQTIYNLEAIIEVLENERNY
ncbi:MULTISPECIES: hypothetical protein [unclassified Niallia]|uniref:hypothetical protein n=1 Tax=unclassified Niallia TaxID=2837522 RepID=UPI001ED9CAE7|nr:MULTISPECIES: hypothetical protein [unclassified Niallia]MDL0435645.1 hypothetical protein [Niallia sp. SS-2023]UPO86517.1 hypothetical protein L8T27_013015 [Niallia sp. Man26]